MDPLACIFVTHIILVKRHVWRKTLLPNDEMMGHDHDEIKTLSTKVSCWSCSHGNEYDLWIAFSLYSLSLTQLYSYNYGIFIIIIR